MQIATRNILSATTEDFKKLQEALEDLESVREYRILTAAPPPTGGVGQLDISPPPPAKEGDVHVKNKANCTYLIN